MADGSLTFCLQQHQLPLRRLRGATTTAEAPAADALRQRWLDRVANGRALAAVAFASVQAQGLAHAADDLFHVVVTDVARLQQLLSQGEFGAIQLHLQQSGAGVLEAGAA
jgi:hypothetical protein